MENSELEQCVLQFCHFSELIDGLVSAVERGDIDEVMFVEAVRGLNIVYSLKGEEAIRKISE